MSYPTHFVLIYLPNAIFVPLNISTNIKPKYQWLIMESYKKIGLSHEMGLIDTPPLLIKDANTYLCLLFLALEQSHESPYMALEQSIVATFWGLFPHLHLMLSGETRISVGDAKLAAYSDVFLVESDKLDIKRHS